MSEANSARDLRVDFFRGLALYMIVLDHTVGSPLGRLTFKTAGFADAAEIFVFLSGFVGGIRYRRLLLQDGWPALWRKLSTRALRIFVFAVLTSIAVTAIDIVAKSPNAPFGDRGVHAPVAWLRAVVTNLFDPDSVVSILPVYVLFTLIVVPLFLLAAPVSLAATLAASAAVWGVVQLFPMPLLEIGGFNPLAWQFLFVIGLAFGAVRFSPKVNALLASKWLLLAAWSVVLAALAYRAAFHFGGPEPIDTGWLTSVVRPPWETKVELAWPRLLHFLAAALLVSVYLRKDNPIIRWPVFAPLIAASRASLEIFSLGCVLALLASAYVRQAGPSLWMRLSLDCALVLILAVFALGLNAKLRNRSPAQPQ